MTHTRRRLDPISVLGEILITFGILAGLFAFWEVYWTNIQSAREQAVVAGELDDQWDSRNPRPLTEPSPGTAFARLLIPSFGSDFNYSVVVGTTDADLDKGPGHYIETQGPGQPGNFALAGHRVGRGAPFNDLGLLNTCDSIVIETAGSWNIYRVLPIDASGEGAPDPASYASAASACLSPELVGVMEQRYHDLPGRFITVPSDINVINPVPGEDRVSVEEGDVPLLTLTTCHPQYSNAERMIVHAVMTQSYPKAEGFMPPELTNA